MDKKLRIFFSLALFWLINKPSFGQEIDSICWAKELKLKWSDFKGEPDTSKVTYMGVGAKAQTHAIISAKGFLEDGLPNYVVSNRFIKSQSWSIDTVQINTLNHEQLHFNIAELYARKIRKGILELRQKKIKDIEVYTQFINRTLKDLYSRNNQYDLQTGHGVVEIIQEEWKTKINCELDLLKEYETPKDCQ